MRKITDGDVVLVVMALEVRGCEIKNVTDEVIDEMLGEYNGIARAYEVTEVLDVIAVLDRWEKEGTYRRVEYKVM